MATPPRKQSPGTFSRNFAWGHWRPSKGLRKIYDCIRDGFGGSSIAVSARDFRTRCGEADTSLNLLPVRFYLFSVGPDIQVDELVYQAISRPHSIDFDRLVLFALNLSDVGTPLGAPRRPAMWANSFVRQKLWAGGAWQRAELDTASMDTFIASTVLATGDVRTKIRTNYRFLYDRAGYTTALPLINSGATNWGASALYLAWDRFIMGGGSRTVAALHAHAVGEELWKLLGIDRPSFDAGMTIALRDYVSAGTIDRFTASAIQAGPRPSASPAGTSFAPSGTAAPAALPPAAWLDQDGSDAAVERLLRLTHSQKRDRKIAADVRIHYDHRCMFCGVQLEVGDGRYYAEAAHIKPLGAPHSGPDKTGNLLVLCPNHHLQFDRGMLRLVATKGGFKIKSAIHADPLHGKLMATKHALDLDCVKYHYDWHEPTGR